MGEGQASLCECCRYNRSVFVRYSGSTASLKCSNHLYSIHALLTSSFLFVFFCNPDYIILVITKLASTD